MLAMLNGDSGGAALNMERRVGNAMIVGNEITSFIHEFNHTAPGPCFRRLPTLYLQVE